MDQAIRKRGPLYLQQQRFGKKWKKVWAVLHRESTCSISRLEFFESKDGGTGTLERAKAKQENKKVIRLNDCIRVSEADVDGCPRDCRPFVVETTEKTFVFASETSEQEDWIQKLCEIAFPMNWGERGAGQRNSQPAEFAEVSMTNNSLYGGKETGVVITTFVGRSSLGVVAAVTSGATTPPGAAERLWEAPNGANAHPGPKVMKDFKVTMRRTDAAERCGLRGQYLLRTDLDSLLLKEPKTGEVLFTWPYCYLRRFGKDKTTFSFEAGRRCQSGEGNFEFDTKLGSNIFQFIEETINVQKASLIPQQPTGGAVDQDPALHPPKLTPPPEDPAGTVYSMLNQGTAGSGLDTPPDKHLTGVKSLNLETRPQPKKSQVKIFRSCPLVSTDEDAAAHSREEPSRPFHPASRSGDPEYSLPFDSIAKNVMADILASSHPPLEPGAERRARAEPLYDSIDESAVRPPPCQHRRPGKYVPEHIYDEPEGHAAAAALYDDPEEVKGQAWKARAAGEPSGHEYPYDAQADDYAVPKPPRRVNVPKREREEAAQGASPYDNISRKV